ncbi:MAG: transglycosylase SLT domain-containing protein [Myxococcales bacterium]|nr:transglycosylase SLT domain-containing protein [Myxococcales bacterium]
MPLPRFARPLGLALLALSFPLLPEGLDAEHMPIPHALAAGELDFEPLFDLPFERPEDDSPLGRLFADLDRMGLRALEDLSSRLEPLEPDLRGKVAYAAARFAGQAGDRQLALRAYREVPDDHVLAPWAERHVERLASKPAEAQAAQAAERSEGERLLEEAQRFMRAKRFELAHTRARRAAVRSRGELRCTARLVEAQAASKLGRRVDEQAVLERVIKGCDPGETVTTARFRVASSYAATGQAEKAVAHYDALAEQDPTSSLADDALFRASRLLRELGDVEGAVARLRTLIDVHARGDMASDAAFELGWLLRGLDRADEALAVYRDAEARGLDARAEDQRGRFTYHRARILLERGDREEAVDVFAGLVLRWPLTYYGFQAQARLAELDPPRLASIRERIVRAERKGPRVELASIRTEGFARATALLEVRSFDEAQRELESIGLLGPRSDAQGRLVAAHLFYEAGDSHRALWLYRRNFDDLGEVKLDREGIHKLRLAYPKEYEREIAMAAKDGGISEALLRAVAREESSFQPSAVSHAGARGLVQLMPATAQSLAGKLGVPLPGPRAVFEPEVNLKLGAHYLAFLESRFDKQIGLVPAAYNAGQGNVDRWLARAETNRLDDFVEAIPFAETRRYTRRVLQSYGVYALLDEGRWLDLPAHLPGRD